VKNKVVKTAIVHEWLVNYAGSEKVLEQIIKLYPEADLFCVCDFLPDNSRDFILNKKTFKTFIQNLPFAKEKYRNYLPLMPLAMRSLDLSGYDLIISNSHSVAKGIKKRPDQLQVCYCHTPMRYAWDLREQYLKEAGLDSGLKGAAIKFILNRLKNWDYNTAQQVDHFIANSHYIKDRIKRAYNRDAKVIYPPVNIEMFQVTGKKEEFFLAVSRMVSYKKMDLIVEAFALSGLPLVVIGDGPDLEKVKRNAKDNIKFLGFQSDDVLIEYMQKARAFVFAAEEDFGIVPVEAQACGTPVIAFGKGGTTETVIPLNSPANDNSEPEQPPTGVFFKEQTVTALNDAVKEFISEETRFDALKIRSNAERFSIERFREEFNRYVYDKTVLFF